MEVGQTSQKSPEADCSPQSLRSLSGCEMIIDEFEIFCDEFCQAIADTFLQFIKSWEIVSTGNTGAGELVLSSESPLAIFSICFYKCQTVGISDLLPRLNLPAEISDEDIMACCECRV